MKTNVIPEIVSKQLEEHYGPYFVYSFDVNDKSDTAIVAVGWEDPDFPELWLFKESDGELRKIDDSSVLIDYPLSKAFWAENGKDIIVSTADPEPSFSLLILDRDSGKVEQMDYAERTSYTDARFHSVESFA